MRLAGMFILTDDAEGALPLPCEYDVDDIPVIVQDVRLDKAGQFSPGERAEILVQTRATTLSMYSSSRHPAP